MPTETTSNAPTSKKRYRAGVYDTEGKLLKIKTATSEELLQVIVGEYVGLGYVVKKGFVKNIDGKLFWLPKGVREREAGHKVTPKATLVVPSIHYA